MYNIWNLFRAHFNSITHDCPKATTNNNKIFYGIQFFFLNFYCEFNTQLYVLIVNFFSSIDCSCPHITHYCLHPICKRSTCSILSSILMRRLSWIYWKDTIKHWLQMHFKPHFLSINGVFQNRMSKRTNITVIFLKNLLYCVIWSECNWANAIEFLIFLGCSMIDCNHLTS